MNHPIRLIQRDTRAWRAQVWISFILALVVSASGLGWLPGTDIDRGFMFMGYVFCLTSSFALSKFVRDNADRPSDTPMWSAVVWGGFALAVAMTGWGLWQMDINPTWKAYLLVSWLYLMSSAFTLAKTLRDAHEADLLEQGAGDEAAVAAQRAARAYAAVPPASASSSS